jgi:hypothetical protein
VIDVAELMTDRDFVKCFTVKRPTVTVSANGTSSVTFAEFEAVGAVQPASPNDVQTLPEGTRLDDVLSVWSHETIRGADGKTRESDVLVVDGQPYRVVKVEPRTDNGYTRVFAEGFTP